MLGKLLKYDYKSSIFYFLLMYAVLMGIAVMARMSFVMFDSDYFAYAGDHALSIMTMAGATILYFLACGAVMVLTLLVIAMRFYRNLMGPEGYLSFTLPVSKGSHLAAKMISGVSFLLLSFLMLFLSLLLLTVGQDFWDGFGAMIFRDILNALRMDHPLIAALYLLEGFVATVQIVAVIYVSICIGQLAVKHRVLGAIGIYLAINLVLGIVTTLGSEIFRMLLEGSEGSLLYFAVTSTATILFRALVTAGSLAGSLLLMKHRLNLE